MTGAELSQAAAQAHIDARGILDDTQAGRGRGWKMPMHDFAALLGARARLFDRAADAAAGCTAARPEPVDDAARADEVLAAYLAPEREAARVEELRLVAMHERYAREAAEKMAAWRRGGRA